MKYETICEGARILVDTHGLTDRQRAARYRRFTGKRIATATVSRAREKFWQRINSAPSKRIGSIRL